MNNFKQTALLILFLGMMLSSSAQTKDTLEEFFYTSGKIKMVIAVIGIVLVGLFVFLIYLDRKVSRLEKHSKKH
ncbi:MAG: hypothetical protein SGI87_00180 [Flavobacteriales bacterium]|nr:hypothetical protein [Flavobacteriales bacterium]